VADPRAKARTSPRFPDGFRDVTLRVPEETREGLNKMTAAYGFKDRNEFVSFLVKMWSEGVVAVMDKGSKELLVGAAEDKILTLAKRAARSETNYVLWQLGFKATPYEE
jgi:hypothetical protein